MLDIEKYIIARWAYGHGFDFMSDVEYNELHQKMLNSEYADYAKTSWSLDVCPAELLAKYNLASWIDDSFKIGKYAESIESVTSVEAFKNILATYKIGDKIKFSYKLDGWNISSHYFDGKYVSSNTRGRERDSRDVSPVMRQLIPQEIPLKGKVLIMGELSIPNQKWEQYKYQINGTSQRSSVSTAIANQDSDVLVYDTFDIESEQQTIIDKYKTLTEFGFNTPYYEILEINSDNSDERLKQAKSIFDSLFDFLPTYGRKTDGIVFETERQQLALRIWQWGESYYESTIIDYIETFGRHRTNIELKIKPVVVNGATIEKLNVNNISNIVDYDLAIGNKVIFSMRSAAIPDINFWKSKEANYVK